jgi:uncharacterized membrane protein
VSDRAARDHLERQPPPETCVSRVVQMERPNAIFASRAARVAIFVIAAVAAAAVALAAGLFDWLSCESGPSAACDRRSLAHAQLIVGWVAAGVALGAGALELWRGRVLATIALVLAVATVVFWALLADAAVHGWDDLKVFPF